MSTIALVDDDKHILTSLSMAFEAEGYHTQTDVDGRLWINDFPDRRKLTNFAIRKKDFQFTQTLHT